MTRNNTCSAARAEVKGIGDCPDIHGTVTFRQMTNGVLVTARICGLPTDDGCGIFAFHIHGGTSCSGDADDPFADAGAHYNSDESPHPCHAGDLPPLFGNSGYAYMSVLTNRFTVKEIIGKTIVIHSKPDDFKTQPSGDSGIKIACGKIRR